MDALGPCGRLPERTASWNQCQFCGLEPTYPTIDGGGRDFERCSTASVRVTSPICSSPDADGAGRNGGKGLCAPAALLVRLTDLGLLHRVATGFYVAVPDDQVGTGWMPGVEAAAAGIAIAAYGPDEAVVMGVSAARLHGANPRALATAVVAVPTRHDPIQLADRQAVVRFVVRDTARLDADRIDTDLGSVLVTTAEQTVLDLAKRSGLGDAEGEVWPAVEQFYRKCNPDVVAEIADAQKMRTTLTRLPSSSAPRTTIFSGDLIPAQSPCWVSTICVLKPIELCRIRLAIGNCRLASLSLIPNQSAFAWCDLSAVPMFAT